MKRYIFLALFLAALGYGGYWAWHNKETITDLLPSKQTVQLPTAIAERRDIETTLMLTGEVLPKFQIEVKPEVSGRLKRLHVRPGDTVKKDDLLAEIDDTDIQIDLAAADIEIIGAHLRMEQAEANFTRTKALYDKKLTTRENFENQRAASEIAKNDLKRAHNRLDIIKDRLSKTQITAPADGTVLEIPVAEGQVVVAAASVTAGTLLMTFADLKSLIIKSHVNQVDAPQLNPGAEVTVSVSGVARKTAPARIDFIAPVATVKNNIKGFALEAAILKNEDDFLKPGMSVSMSVPVSSARDVVAVPVTAVVREGRRNFVVYVQPPGEKALPEKRTVNVGVSDNQFIEIRDGINEGDIVLLTEPK